MEILYINSKNEIEDILYIFPNDRNVCNKLEKEIINDKIENLTKNIFSNLNEQENPKEFYYCEEDGNKISYKVLNKKQFITKKNTNENNKNNKIKDNKNKSIKYEKANNDKAQKVSDKNLILPKSENNSIKTETKKEKDINKLRLELLEKIKNYENLNIKIQEKSSELSKNQKNLEIAKSKFNEEKNIFYKEQKKNNTNNDADLRAKLEDIKYKCSISEKEYENKQKELSRMKKVLLENEKFLQSYKEKNNNLIKLK